MNPAIARWKNVALRAQQSSRRARAKAGELMETAVHTVETGGTAFALGYLQGSLSEAERDKFELFGVPIPLAIGVASHTLAVMGVGRGMEPHFRAVGNGALACHLFGVGRQVAQGRGGRTAVRGSLPGSRARASAGISAQDLAELSL